MAAVWCHWAMLLRGLSCTGSLTFFLIAVTVLPTELMLHAYALTPWILGHVLGTDMVAHAHKSRCYDNAGVGLGYVGVKFLHIERKKTSVSVVHSRPPSHYMRTHALGWPYWFHALRIFLESHKEFGIGLVSFKFTVTLNANRTLCGIYNGFSRVGGGLGRGWTLIWNRDGLWWLWHLWPQRKPRLFGEDVDLDEKVKKVWWLFALILFWKGAGKLEWCWFDERTCCHHVAFDCLVMDIYPAQSRALLPPVTL